MIPRTTYHDRGDRILKIETRSPHERVKAWLPKPHTLGEGATINPPERGGNEPRRIETKRRGDATHQAGAAHPNRTDCVHSLGSTGERVGHDCGGCAGGQFTTVFDCELYGRVAPLAWAPLKADVAGVRRCIDCGAYRPQQSAAAA